MRDSANFQTIKSFHLQVATSNNYSCGSVFRKTLTKHTDYLTCPQNKYNTFDQKFAKKIVINKLDLDKLAFSLFKKKSVAFAKLGTS